MSISHCRTRTDARGREYTPHGSPLFPVACYEEAPAAQAVPWHWHEEFELILSAAGSFSVALGRELVTISPGDGLFINSGTLHEVPLAAEPQAMLRSLVFQPQVLGGPDSVFWHTLIHPLLRAGMEGQFAWRYLSREVPWQRQILEELKAAWDAMYREPEDFENLTRYHLSRAFRYLSQHCPADPGDQSRHDQASDERIKAMLRFIQQHYTEELTVERIAQSANISSSGCLRCFRQVLGTTPIQYLKHYRIQRAAQLLLETERKISDIALTCGFGDISYFTKSFREEKGLPPKQFRAQNKNSSLD